MHSTREILYISSLILSSYMFSAAYFHRHPFIFFFCAFWYTKRKNFFLYVFHLIRISKRYLKWSWRAVFDDDGRDDDWPWILWENYHLLLLLISFYLTFFKPVCLSLSLSLCVCLISWWQLWSCCSSIIIIINNNNNSNYVTFSIYIQPKTDHVLVVLYSAYDERRGHRTLMYNCEHRREIIYFVVFFSFGLALDLSWSRTWRLKIVTQAKDETLMADISYIDLRIIVGSVADGEEEEAAKDERQLLWKHLVTSTTNIIIIINIENKKRVHYTTHIMFHLVILRYTRYVSTHQSTVTYTRPRPLSSALDSTFLEKRLFPYNCWWIQNWWWTSNFKTKPKKLRIITSPLIFFWDLLDFVLCMEQRRERP